VTCKERTYWPQFLITSLKNQNLCHLLWLFIRYARDRWGGGGGEGCFPSRFINLTISTCITDRHTCSRLGVGMKECLIESGT
jgi:hypothetical protein